MVVWGGYNGSYLNTGSEYDPSTDSWVSTTTTGAPAAREVHTAAWTGSEMIVWGGNGNSGYLNTGGRYNPSTNTWLAITTTRVPAARALHTAVWTGNEMIVWGGDGNSGYLTTGGRYNPSTDTWVTTTTGAAAMRHFHTAVWSGGEMIVWGGFNNDGSLNAGGRYSPQAPSTPVVLSALSRKVHASSGTPDANLPLTGTPGIESRTGVGTNDYTLMITCNANVSVNGSPQAAVRSGIGIIGSGGVSNGGSVITADNVVIIPLTNVANAQTIQVALYGVNGSTNFVIPMNILIGDTNGSCAVNASDVSIIKSNLGTGVP
jgi:hypothetical protein